MNKLYSKNLSLSPIIAHRGASGQAPENTLISIARAAQLGAKWVEFDVRLTADDKVIVFHDAKLNRTTNGSGMVIQHDYAKLEKLDAGTWFDSKFSGEKIPTLKAMLVQCAKLKLHIAIDIKADMGHEATLIEKVFILLKQYWNLEQNSPIICSNSIECLKMVRDGYPNIWIGLTVNKWAKDWEKVANQVRCQSLHVNYKALNQQRVKKMKDTYRLVLAYTVNNQAVADRLFQWGISAIFTDTLINSRKSS